MPYTMTIYTKKSAVGHFAIELNDGKGNKTIAGFGPEKGFKGALSLVSPTKGKMDKNEEFNSNEFLSSRPVTLTKEQYEQALLYRDHYEKLVNKGRIKYEANGNNCIRFAGSLLNSIGSKENLDDILSEDQKDVVNLANASIDPARTASTAKRKTRDTVVSVAQDVGDAMETGEQAVLAAQMTPFCAGKAISDSSASVFRGDGVDVKEQIKNISDCAVEGAGEIRQAGKVAAQEMLDWAYDRAVTAKGYVDEKLDTLSAWGKEKGAQIQNGIDSLFSGKAEEPDTSTDPRVGAMLELMASPVSRPGLAALLKPVETLTEAEMKDMINSAQSDYRGWRSSDPLKAHTYEKVQDWHVAMYGDGPQQYDGGKAIEPAPIRPIPAQPTPHLTPDGADLWQAISGLGRTVASAANTDGFETAIQGLQQGLNLLNQHTPLPPRSPAYGPYTTLDPVKVDGVYGPRTDFALKQTAARLGPDKVEDGLALGRFNGFARKAQSSRNPDGLDRATQTAFGSLFRDPADTQSPKAENGVLQNTLNRFGAQTYDDWQPLKQDNWIGPKTTAAFGRLLDKTDADTITTAFGRGLGLMSG